MSTTVSTAPARLPGVINLMGAAAGLVGANVHYSQPLLPLIALTMGVSAEFVSALPAVTQIGFAVGLLIVLPLADMIERKKLVLTTIVIAMIALVGQGLAPSVGWLLLAGLFVGAASVAPQVLSPFAAFLAPPGREGQAAGTVLSGILMGVLLSKVVAGTVAATVSWQALYIAASAVMLVLAFVLWRALPTSQPTEHLRLVELLLSPIRMLRAYGRLRLHAWLGFLVSAMFMAFWATYAIHLHAEFGWGPFVAGLFGIAGIAGSLLAPLSGRAVDRGRVLTVFIVSGIAALVAFLGFGVGGDFAIILVLGILLLDGAVGLAHAANQARIFGIDPERRGRLNSVYMFSYFIGGAFGTATAAAAYATIGWIGVAITGATLAVVALVTTSVAARRGMFAD
ncbi:MFS transporter [Microbacterium sp. CPCC 204701]|uniref:MFS transporter n=1 Tax=Microbacterium sp. CPCC 204701 TaxID=2493084 RepID=UPI000FDC569E|nr:MFS transporter [Microbacterium sp. CPCC 204701]